MEKNILNENAQHLKRIPLTRIVELAMLDMKKLGQRTTDPSSSLGMEIDSVLEASEYDEPFASPESFQFKIKTHFKDLQNSFNENPINEVPPMPINMRINYIIAYLSGPNSGILVDITVVDDSEKKILNSIIENFQMIKQRLRLIELKFLKIFANLMARYFNRTFKKICQHLIYMMTGLNCSICLTDRMIANGQSHLKKPDQKNPKDLAKEQSAKPILTKIPKVSEMPDSPFVKLAPKKIAITDDVVLSKIYHKMQRQLDAKMEADNGEAWKPESSQPKELTKNEKFWRDEETRISFERQRAISKEAHEKRTEQRQALLHLLKRYKGLPADTEIIDSEPTEDDRILKFYNEHRQYLANLLIYKKSETSLALNRRTMMPHYMHFPQPPFNVGAHTQLGPFCYQSYSNYPELRHMDKMSAKPAKVSPPNQDSFANKESTDKKPKNLPE